MAEMEIPPYFLCPITLEIMRDPVTLSTGITYERDSIEQWIFTQKNSTCPATNQPLLSPLDLTPNTTLRRLIQSWCTLHSSTHGVERLPTPKPPLTRPHLLKLLSAPHLHLQTLKSLAADSQTNRRTMESAGAADFLASLIVKSPASSAAEDALAIICSLQLSEQGLKPLCNLGFVEALTLIMNRGSYESKTYALMLLKSMLQVADPSLLITLTPAFFTEIARLFKDDDVSIKGSKAALKILVAACPWGRNRVKAVEAGVVAAAIDLLLASPEKRVCEMILTVVDVLCQCADGRAELIGHAAGLAVVSKKILRVSAAASERAVRILHSVSRYSGTGAVAAEMLQVGAVAKLCLVVQVESGSKMKERAREILKMHARVWKNSSCIPNNLISAFP